MSFDGSAPGTPPHAWDLDPRLAGLPLLAMSAPDHVIVVAAHPDDETLGAGGLIAECSAAGIPIDVVIVTDGGASHPQSSSTNAASLAALRGAEAVQAIGLLAASSVVTFLEYPDGMVREHRAAIHSDLGDIIDRRDGSLLIVSTWRGDGHRDHRVVGEICAQLALDKDAELIEYPIWMWHWANPSHPDTPWDSLAVLPLTADAAAAKARAIDVYQSQTVPLSDAPGDRAVLDAQFLQHFSRDWEAFVIAGAATRDGGSVSDAALIDPALIDPALIDAALIDPVLVDTAVADIAVADAALLDLADAPTAPAETAAPGTAAPPAASASTAAPAAASAPAEPAAASAPAAPATPAEPGASLPQSYFDGAYSRRADPWGFETRWYEGRKRAITMAALPRERYSSALEIGSSIGVLTNLLADRCDEILAVDISQAAVDSARARLDGRPDRGAHVRFETADVGTEFPTGDFDLVLLSEVGYYFDAETLEHVIDHIESVLTESGTVVACHWRHPVTDYPLSGDDVHAALRSRDWHRVATHIEEDFVLDVFSRDGRSVARVTGLL